MRKFIDDLIDIKLLEIESKLSEVNVEIDKVVRRLHVMDLNSELTISYRDRFVDLIIERHRLCVAENKLSRAFNRRTIECMVNDPELNKE